jgi:hypothetical protein
LIVWNFSHIDEVHLIFEVCSAVPSTDTVPGTGTYLIHLTFEVMEKEEGVRSARRRKSLESELQVLYTQYAALFLRGH